MSASELNERERQVLQALLFEYTVTAEPVGSRQLARKHALGLSPATIRNTMADLEETGFLVQPHTSAGRVPTDKAYRYYVDSLMGRSEMVARTRIDSSARSRAPGARSTTSWRRLGAALRALPLRRRDPGAAAPAHAARARRPHPGRGRPGNRRAGDRDGVGMSRILAFEEPVPRSEVREVARLLTERSRGSRSRRFGARWPRPEPRRSR